MVRKSVIWRNEHIYNNILIKQASQDKEDKLDGFVEIPAEDSSKDDVVKGLVANVKWQVTNDRKSTALKQIQGNVWNDGYTSGEIKSK